MRPQFLHTKPSLLGPLLARLLLLQPHKLFVLRCSHYKEDSKAPGSTSSIAAALTSRGFQGEEVSLSVLGLACGCFGSTLPFPRSENSFAICPATSGHQRTQAAFQNTFLNPTLLSTCQYTPPLPHVKTGCEGLATYPIRRGQHNFCPRSASPLASFAAHREDGKAAGTGPWSTQGSRPWVGSPIPRTWPRRLCGLTPVRAAPTSISSVTLTRMSYL